MHVTPKIQKSAPKAHTLVCINHFLHAIRNKFDDIFSNEKHPELPDDGIDALKDPNKSKAKRIKRLLKKNSRAV